jgi:glycosyltransferase involved in cell wall biosynthesis
MKKYIIITGRISDMGGAQLYVLRRALHLKQCGFDVLIIVAIHSDYFPLKASFENVSFYVVPEVKTRVAQQTYNTQKKLLNKLERIIGPFDECYVESHTLSTIEWGELLAAKCGARHLAYSLAESEVARYRFQPGKRIFDDKLAKGEFWGCSSVSLKKIFGREDVPVNYVNIGYDESEFVDECFPALEYHRKKGDYVVTTITRLDKTYVEWLADAVAEMARKYEKQNFVLLIAGGSPHQDRVDYVKANFNTEIYGLANLNIVYLGYIDKLGKDLFRMSDVFVGMGTASINSISQRCITINIDPLKGMQKASGFFGVDTKNFAYSENGRVYPIFEKIEEAYLFTEHQKEKVRNTGRVLFEEEYDLNNCLRKLDSVIQSLEIVKERKNIHISDGYRLLVKSILNIKQAIFKRDS